MFPAATNPHSWHTAAFNAATRGDTRRLARMLQEGLDPDLRSSRRNGGSSLMCRAIENGHWAAADLLWQSGAKPRTGELQAALQKGNAWAEVQERLRAAVYPAGTLRKASTLLCRAGDAPTARRVLGWRPDPPDPEEGRRALAHAMDQGDFRLAEILATAGALPDLDWGWITTAIDGLLVPLAFREAPEGYRLKWVELLIVMGGPDILKRPPSEGFEVCGRPPLHAAASRAFPQVVRCLLEAGANPEEHAALSGGGTPLKGAFYFAGHARQPRTDDRMSERMEVCRLLLEAGASLDGSVQDEEGWRGVETLRQWGHRHRPEWAVIVEAMELERKLSADLAPGGGPWGRPRM